LAKKLGIKANSVVALVRAPKGFERTLKDLPKGVMVRRGVGGRRNLTVWFTKSRRNLERCITRRVSVADNGGLWIVWPKKTSGMGSDLSESIVRAVGLAEGLVDFKVCAIDATWSGLRFTRRKSK